ncbi:hypothetical protein DFJ74DRAFT_683187 [Hyaloraphidium curvatum]|nr:hypothetical protein DFJ74DRAFT_683187 [Hyaloraphidium curvatum]
MHFLGVTKFLAPRRGAEDALRVLLYRLRGLDLPMCAAAATCAVRCGGGVPGPQTLSGHLESCSARLLDTAGLLDAARRLEFDIAARADPNSDADVSLIQPSTLAAYAGNLSFLKWWRDEAGLPMDAGDALLAAFLGRQPRTAEWLLDTRTSLFTTFLFREPCSGYEDVLLTRGSLAADIDANPAIYADLLRDVLGGLGGIIIVDTLRHGKSNYSAVPTSNDMVPALRTMLGLTVAQHPDEIFRFAPSPSGTLDGPPLLFRARSAAVARIVLDAAEPERVNEWLRAMMLPMPPSRPRGVLSHLKYPHAWIRDVSNGAAPSFASHTSELADVYRNREEMLQLYLGLLRERVDDRMFRLGLCRHGLFLEHIKTPSWISYLHRIGALLFPDMNPMALLLTAPGRGPYPGRRAGDPAACTALFRAVRRTSSLLPRSGRAAPVSSHDLAAALWMIGDRAGPYAGFRGLVRLLLWMGAARHCSAVGRAARETGYDSLLAGDVEAVRYAARWCEVGFGGLPGELCEEVVMRWWEVEADPGEA